MRTTVQTAMTAILPPICPVTGDEVGGHGALSPEAWGELAFLATPGCRRCGREIAGLDGSDPDFVCDACLKARHPWDRGRAAFSYEGTGRRLVLSLKHGDRLDLVPLLAGWMTRAAPAMIAEADLIAPIPLHWTRRVRRRYNQSAELARAICAIADRTDRFAPDLLKRIRSTPTQDGRDRDARRKNVADAMIVPDSRRMRVAGTRVLLVDDVMTTGATLDAATEACLAAGAAAVDVVVSALVNYEAAPYVASTVPPEEMHDETD